MPLSGYHRPFGLDDWQQLRIHGCVINSDYDIRNMRYVFSCGACGKEIAECSQEAAEDPDQRDSHLSSLAGMVRRHQFTCRGSRESQRPQRISYMPKRWATTKTSDYSFDIEPSKMVLTFERTVDPKDGAYLYECCGCRERVFRFPRELMPEYSETQIKRLYEAAMKEHADQCKRLHTPAPKRLRVIRMG